MTKSTKTHRVSPVSLKMAWLAGVASLVAGPAATRAADRVVLMASTIGPPVNPAKLSRVNHAGAVALVEWLTSPAKGQKIVESFGRERYGSPPFLPDSRAWNAAQRK